MSGIIQVAILAVAFFAGFSSHFLFKNKQDSLIEEAAEAVIKHQTGMDIDFTPDSQETATTLKPSVIVVSQEEWDDINEVVTELERDPLSPKKARAVELTLERSQRKALPLKTIIPDHEDFDNVFMGDNEGLDIKKGYKDA